MPEFLTWKLQKFFAVVHEGWIATLAKMQGRTLKPSELSQPKDFAADFLVAAMKSGPQQQRGCGPEFSWSSRQLISFFRLQPSVPRRLQPALLPAGP